MIQVCYIYCALYFYFVAIWRYSALTLGSGFMPLWESNGTADLTGGGAQVVVWAVGSGCKALLHCPLFTSCCVVRCLVYGVLKTKWRKYVQKDVITVSNLAAAAKLLQLCPTLCDPIDGSPSGSSVSGILQARTLEWVAISFSSVVSDSVRPYGRQPTRLLCPQDSLGKNTGVDCHFLLQCQILLGQIRCAL